MKTLLVAFTFLFATSATALPKRDLNEREDAITNLSDELERRVAVAEERILSELTPPYLSMDLRHLRKMIFNLLGPHDADIYVQKENLARYRAQAELFNLKFGRLREDHRFNVSLMPLRKKEIAPELFRIWLERYKLNNAYLWIRVANSVTWNNLPLALRLTEQRAEATDTMLSQYESLLDRTRVMPLPQLRLFVLSPRAAFRLDGFLDQDFFANTANLSRWSAYRRYLRATCQSHLRGNPPRASH